MNRLNYHQLRVAELQYVSGGTKDSRHSVLPVVTKQSFEAREREKNPKELPFLVGNEGIARNLGELLGLPVLPGGIALSNGKPRFFCANFRVDIAADRNLTPDGERPNETDWSRAINKDPAIGWGILLFDAWILNPDRAPVNLAYNNEIEQFILFDHEACLYNGQQHGSPRLKNQRDNLVAAKFPEHHRDSSLKGKVKSPFIRQIETADQIEDYYEKIKSLPTWQIRDAVFAVEGAGYRTEDCEEVCEFLIHRRQLLYTMICDNSDYFVSLSRGEFQKIQKLAGKTTR